MVQVLDNHELRQISGGTPVIFGVTITAKLVAKAVATVAVAVASFYVGYKEGTDENED